MNELILTEENFETALQDEKPLLVDFWAEWCGPCKMTAPILEQVCETHPEIRVGKINVDEQAALAARFDIMSIPTLILFENGKEKKREIGFMPYEKLVAAFEL